MNWANLNRYGFRLADNLLISRTQHIKDRVLQGLSEVFQDSNPKVHFSTTCRTPKLVSDCKSYFSL